MAAGGVRYDPEKAAAVITANGGGSAGSREREFAHTNGDEETARLVGGARLALGAPLRRRVRAACPLHRANNPLLSASSAYMCQQRKRSCAACSRMFVLAVRSMGYAVDDAACRVSEGGKNGKHDGVHVGRCSGRIAAQHQGHQLGIVAGDGQPQRGAAQPWLRGQHTCLPGPAVAAGLMEN